MRTYRFIEFNLGGVVDRAHEVAMRDDEAARAYAATLPSPKPVEVWRGGRLVARVVPTPPR
ncbi:MAG: hypothetical protein JO290_01885 [Sphingomonadaceae bacterium]|nr:hypothetical protein [Sphingomonadaceae bacterium]